LSNETDSPNGKTIDAYLGVDVGSVSTNVVALDRDGGVLSSVYLRTMGQPIKAVQEGMREVGGKLDASVVIRGAGATGSAR